MTHTATALFALATTAFLANCSGTQDLSELPVRDGPQRISPITLVTPDVEADVETAVVEI